MPTPLEVSQSLLAVLVFLFAAHLGGFLFQRYKQPGVIGEIAGGILLGPSLLGWMHPELFHTLFVGPTRAGIALTLIYNFGLLMLMFISGLEAESLFQKGKKRSIFVLATLGTAIPLLAALGLSFQVDLSEFYGERGDRRSLAILLGCAAAVTSLPVISRIFMDLGIIKTPFARLILSASLIDDIILYFFMAVAVTLSDLKFGSSEIWVSKVFPEASELLQIGILGFSHLVFMISVIAFGKWIISWLKIGPFFFLKKRSPVSFYIAALLFFAICGHLLSVPFVLSAFAAGIAVCSGQDLELSDKSALRDFSLSFFIPIYFAYVGFRIDLSRDFDFMLTLALIGIGSLLKISSIYFSSRVAGISSRISRSVAMAMNARGGPGIVLASVAFDAKIIGSSLFVSLVLTAIVTSMVSGAWLQSQLKKGSLNLELN